MTTISVQKIFNYLDERAAGQKQVKKALAYAGFLHITKSLVQTLYNCPTSFKKTNILILGPSGCGKTHLTQNLATALNLPFYEINAGSLSLTGFVGKDMEDHLTQYVKQHKDLPQADLEQGIIFLDEIDKLCIPKDTNHHSWCQSAQDSLLKIIEGTTLNLEMDKRTGGDTKMLDTSKMLFVLAGSFKHLERYQVRKGLGFKSNLKTIGLTDNALQEELHQQLIKGGMKLELAGRISLISEVVQLTEQQLYDILCNVKGSIIKQYQFIFEKAGLETIKFTPRVCKQIVRAALKNETGARGLQTELDKYLIDKLEGAEYTIDKLLPPEKKNVLLQPSKVE